MDITVEPKIVQKPMFWDLDIVQPEFVMQMRDLYKGERAFMVGNGPSLKEQEDILDKLNDEIVFTCNGLPVWSDCPFEPMYHTISEPDAYEEITNLRNNTWPDTSSIQHLCISYTDPMIEGWNWVAKAPDIHQVRREGFFGLSDYFPPIPTGWTTPLTAAQIAAWMGVREFYFLGIETTPQGHVFNATDKRTGVHPRIIRGIKESFTRARTEIEAVGGSIIDCTPNGLMSVDKVLEYKELKEIL